MRTNSNGRRQVFENVRAIGGKILEMDYQFEIHAPVGMVWAGPGRRVAIVPHTDPPGSSTKRFNKADAYEAILSIVRQSVRRDRW